MRIKKHLAALMLCLTACLAVSSARADQTDPALEKLFTDLKSADTEPSARAIEAEIWSIWTRSSNDIINGLMTQATQELAIGNADAALEIFTQIIHDAPAFAEAWNKRATTLYLMGRFPESIADIDHVLALEPRHFGALSGLAMCDAELHRTQHALDSLRRAQAIDPYLRGAKENIELLRKQIARESI
jgi:tetratricopeptide (TPR) repeat protein